MSEPEGNNIVSGPMHYWSLGLTKRELFAAMAMQGIGLGASGMGHEHIAAVAVGLADSLIAELAK